MLVLSRKRGEQVCIADGIIVTVLEIQKDRIRLGFDAPDEVVIHRQEVAQRIAQQADRVRLSVRPQLVGAV